MRKAIAAIAIVLMMATLPATAARMMGDVDNSGTINIVDALLVARHDARLTVLEDLGVADVNGDGTVNIVDALLIARYDARLITVFPAQIPDVDPPTPDNDTPPGENDPIPNDEHYTLTITCDPVAGGTATGAGEYPIVLPSELVTMMATPTPGWEFTHWSGDADGSSKFGLIVMDGNKNAVANFREVDAGDDESFFNLTTRASPIAGGSVDVLQDPEELGYISGSRVRVTAVPFGEHVFDYWTGEVENADAISTIVVMDEDKTVTAHFSSAPVVGSYTLTTEAKWVGEPAWGAPLPGMVTPSSGEFLPGTRVTLTALPAEGYMLTYWFVVTQPVLGYPTNNPITLTIDRDTIVEAYFAEIPSRPPTDIIRWFGLIASIVGGVGVVAARKWGV